MEDISHLLQREIFEMWRKLKHAEVKTEDSAVEKLDVKNENEKQEEIQSLGPVMRKRKLIDTYIF